MERQLAARHAACGDAAGQAAVSRKLDRRATGPRARVCPFARRYPADRAADRAPERTSRVPHVRDAGRSARCAVRFSGWPRHPDRHSLPTADSSPTGRRRPRLRPRIVPCHRAAGGQDPEHPRLSGTEPRRSRLCSGRHPRLLPEARMIVPYSYLDRQFSDIDAYLEDIRQVVQSGDFTLGSAVERFEEQFAALTKLPYAVGVASGTDALILPIRALGVGPGDEVITSPNTFVASVASIIMAGARPVFVDNDDEYMIDVDRIEAAITPRTKAILPVHLTGHPADMPAIMAIAERHGLAVMEDAAQAILATIDGQHVGSWGAAAAFSLHPLKNLNVWGDGGIIVTRSIEMRDKLRLLRNHGMATREDIHIWGCNSRLDSVQAVVALRLMGQLHEITAKRIAHARRFDQAFADMSDVITIPRRRPNICQVFHTYVIQVRDRDQLLQHLLDHGIRAKVHYPTPLHLQPAAAGLGYRMGDFPVCERHCQSILTLPVHQHLTCAEVDCVVNEVRRFYGR